MHTSFTGVKTRRSTLPGLLATAFSVLALAGCQAEQDTTATVDTTAPATTAAPAAAPAPYSPSVTPDRGWNTTGGSLSNQRYSPLAEINRDNIGELKGEWVTRLDSGLGPNHSGQGDPIVVDGVIYMVTGQNDVFAISVDTGEILWEYRANLAQDGVIVCCGWVQRGVSVGEGRLYVGTLDARLLALDMNSGAVLWEKQVENPAAGYSITGGTRYWDGLVYVGLAGGEYQTRGRVMAFDAESGDEVWTFYTVPGPGEFGHDTWPDYNDAWMYGGAPVWQTVAIDPELGMVYFSTGNASPDLNGAIREGDNLFTVSILGLDLKTGEYRWHFQQTRHDIWDYDSSSPVVLFDVEKDGELRKGISQISKSGYLFLLDRITGEPLTPIVDTPVPQEPLQFTAATQPIPQGDSMIDHCIDEAPEGYTLVNDGCTYTPFGLEPVLYKPLSGSNWMPTSYDPGTGTLYVCASESIGGAKLDEFTEEDFGVQTGGMIFGGSFQLPQNNPRTYWQVAVDVRDHTRVWREEVSACGAGSTVTAGDLLMTTRGTSLNFMDSSSGELLRAFNFAAGSYASPTVFEHNGRQKILAHAGGSAFGAGPKGDAVWLLSLDGTIEPAPELSGPLITPSIGNPDDAPMPEAPADLARGEAIYTAICQACHGETGQGGHAEGGAIPKDSTIEHIYATAQQGVEEKMPSFASAYGPGDLKSVATYVFEVVLPKAE